MDKLIDIHICDMNGTLFQKLFPKEQTLINDQDIGIIENRQNNFGKAKNDEDLNLFVPAIIEIFRKKYNIIWNAYNYPRFTENNHREILKCFFKRINVNENRSNIVIKFNNFYIKDFAIIINKIKNNKPFVLNVLKEDEINEQELQFFKFPEYISYIRNCNDYNDNVQLFRLIKKINSYIIEKQIYFFELDSTFQDLFAPKCFIECNILLIGESRAGKSSYINRVFSKLVSHEDANLESVTINSSQYTLKKGNIGIKYIDTPGIMNNSNIKFLKKIIDEYFGKIHLIYFFIKSQSNLENCIEILKYIKLKNEKNIKEGYKKIPIIFIKNGDNLEYIYEAPPFFKYLKTILNKNNLLDLYDDKFNQKENKNEKINDYELFNENEEVNKNYDNYCEGNIIQIHVPTGKNMNKIFWLSKEYLIKNNKYLLYEENNEIIQMKRYTKELIEFFIKEKIDKKELSQSEIKHKKTLLTITGAFLEKEKLESSILNNLEILNIKEGSKLKLGIGIFTAIILYPIFFVSLFLPIFVSLNQAKILLFFFNDEYIPNLSIQYGFDLKDLIKYNLKKYLVIKDDENKKDIQIMMKSCHEFLKNLLFYIGPIQCLIKAKELSKELFDLFEEFKNRKDNEWNYKLHEFN